MKEGGATLEIKYIYIYIYITNKKNSFGAGGPKIFLFFYFFWARGVGPPWVPGRASSIIWDVSLCLELDRETTAEELDLARCLVLRNLLRGVTIEN